jgi:DNA-binding beta-propeller fold protein YncE
VVVGFAICIMSFCGADAALFVGNVGENDVLRFDATTGAPLGVFIPTGSGGLARPTGLTFGSDGNLYVSSATSASGINGILEYNGRTGQPLGEFASLFNLPQPQDLTFGPDHNLYVLGGSNVYRFDGQTGNLIGSFVQNLVSPQDLAFGPDNNLYVTDGNTIKLYNGSTGALMSTIFSATGFNTPYGLTFGPDNRLYAESVGLIWRINLANNRVDQFVGAPDPGFSLRFATNGNLFVSDFNGGTVQQFDSTTGQSLGSFVSNPGVWHTTGLAFSPVPEPSSLILLAIGGLSLAGAAARRRARLRPRA